MQITGIEAGRDDKPESVCVSTRNYYSTSAGITSYSLLLFNSFVFVAILAVPREPTLPPSQAVNIQ